MNHLPHRQDQEQQMIVTSCDDTDDCNDDEASAAADSMNDDNADDDMITHQKPDDIFFDEDADDEDEAYVYKNLRSGMMETINVLHQPKVDTNSDGRSSNTSTSSSKESSKPQNTQKLQVLKPRNTDAVLSCPYCFHIVCMDCQRHTSYKNQYRAMFVMNILVRWDMPLQYSNEHRCLEPYHMRAPESSIVSQTTIVISDIDADGTKSPRGPSTDETTTTTATTTTTTTSNNHRKSTQQDTDGNNDNTIYYTVCCANCQTTVAALDMTDEVYHFSGCLASA